MNPITAICVSAYKEITPTTLDKDVERNEYNRNHSENMSQTHAEIRQERDD
jgi:hypothetical protein